MMVERENPVRSRTTANRSRRRGEPGPEAWRSAVTDDVGGSADVTRTGRFIGDSFDGETVARQSREMPLVGDATAWRRIPEQIA